jgi:D-Tyr-tRNAtyr deacylase
MLLFYRLPLSCWWMLHLTACTSGQVEGKLVSSIGPGLLCLVGITSTDTAKEADLL